MKLEEIHALWETDSTVDRTRIGEVSLATGKLRHKYYRILMQERINLQKREAALRQLWRDKYEFYTQGPSTVSQAQNWQMPAIGKILKTEAKTYIDADPDYIDMSLKVGVQKEKIGLLEEILKALADRRWEIKNFLDDAKFKAGE